MFQCVYQHCKLSIDPSICRCAIVYWSIKRFHNGWKYSMISFVDDYLITFSYLMNIQNAQASTTFKQWCITVSWYFWHDAPTLWKPLSSHLYPLVWGSVRLTPITLVTVEYLCITQVLTARIPYSTIYWWGKILTDLTLCWWSVKFSPSIFSTNN